MREYNFKELFDTSIKVANKQFSSITDEERKKYHVFIPDLSGGAKKRDSIRLSYQQNLNKTNIKEFFCEDKKFMTFIKIASLCDSIITYKIICFLGVNGTPTHVMMSNYKVALNTAIQSVLMIAKEELGVEYLNEEDKLLYPTENFEDYLVLSLIINDNTINYKFDLLTFSLLLQILFDYNVEKYKTK